MSDNWMDFNNADSQNSFDLIPKGTIVSVRMTIKPGGYDDPNRGWTGGYATHNHETGSVYLNCEFVITEGQFARRKVWSLIGLFSPKGPEWGNMGRSFIRAILNSSRGISEKDNSPKAAQARRINGLADLDGIEFLARIDVEKDQHDDDKNAIKFAVTPDHKQYANHVNGGSTHHAAQHPPAGSTPPAGGFNSGAQQPAPAPAGHGEFQPVQQTNPAPAGNAGFQPGQQAAPSVEQQGQNPGGVPRPQWAQ